MPFDKQRSLEILAAIAKTTTDGKDEEDTPRGAIGKDEEDTPRGAIDHGGPERASRVRSVIDRANPYHRPNNGNTDIVLGCNEGEKRTTVHTSEEMAGDANDSVTDEAIVHTSEEMAVDANDSVTDEAIVHTPEEMAGDDDASDIYDQLQNAMNSAVKHMCSSTLDAVDGGLTTLSFNILPYHTLVVTLAFADVDKQTLFCTLMYECQNRVFEIEIEKLLKVLNTCVSPEGFLLRLISNGTRCRFSHEDDETLYGEYDTVEDGKSTNYFVGNHCMTHCGIRSDDDNVHPSVESFSTFQYIRILYEGQSIEPSENNQVVMWSMTSEDTSCLFGMFPSKHSKHRESPCFYGVSQLNMPKLAAELQKAEYSNPTEFQVEFLALMFAFGKRLIRPPPNVKESFMEHYKSDPDDVHALNETTLFLSLRQIGAIHLPRGRGANKKKWLFVPDGSQPHKSAISVFSMMKGNKVHIRLQNKDDTYDYYQINDQIFYDVVSWVYTKKIHSSLSPLLLKMASLQTKRDPSIDECTQATPKAADPPPLIQASHVPQKEAANKSNAYGGAFEDGFGDMHSSGDDEDAPDGDDEDAPDGDAEMQHKPPSSVYDIKFGYELPKKEQQQTQYAQAAFCNFAP